MKPLISFVIYNRMGCAVRSLTSLLNSYDDFDLYIVDNGSEDLSWEWLKTIDDSRIIEKKRFDKNEGIVSAVNYILSHRKLNQDWIHFDSDCFLISSNFYDQFKKTFDIFPNLGAVNANSTHYDSNLNLSQIINKDNVSIYYKNDLVGYCFMISSNIMDKLGYLCELSHLCDVELSIRIKQGLNKKIASNLNILVGQIYFGNMKKYDIDLKNSLQNKGITFSCSECFKIQKVCTNLNEDAALFCEQFYKKNHYDFFNSHNKECYTFVYKRLNGQLPLRAESFYSGEFLSEKYLKQRLKWLNYFKEG